MTQHFASSHIKEINSSCQVVKLQLLTVCDRSGRKERMGGGEKSETGFLHFKRVICGCELKVESG